MSGLVERLEAASVALRDWEHGYHGLKIESDTDDAASLRTLLTEAIAGLRAYAELRARVEGSPAVTVTIRHEPGQGGGTSLVCVGDDYDPHYRKLAALKGQRVALVPIDTAPEGG